MWQAVAKDMMIYVSEVKRLVTRTAVEHVSGPYLCDALLVCADSDQWTN